MAAPSKARAHCDGGIRNIPVDLSAATYHFYEASTSTPPEAEFAASCLRAAAFACARARIQRSPRSRIYNPDVTFAEIAMDAATLGSCALRAFQERGSPASPRPHWQRIHDGIWDRLICP